MNRIYQGRVSSVQVLQFGKKGNLPDDWLPAPQGDEHLWQHHALFHDAVNYYLVALLALAAPTNKYLGQLRQRIALPGDAYQIWAPFRRRGAPRRGLRDSVAPYLTPGNPAPTLDEAFAAVLAGSPVDNAIHDAAVSALLEVCDGAGAIQQQGRAYWPKFCDPKTAANFAGDPAMLRREFHQRLLPRVLHAPDTRYDSPTLDEFDAYSIATPDAKRPQLIGPKATERLKQAVALWRARRPEIAAELDRLSILIEQLPPDIVLPGYVGSAAKGDVKARLFALLLFRHVERSEFTFDLLRSATPQRTVEVEIETVSADPAPPTADPIRAARGERCYVFRSFTSLPSWNPADTATPQWKEFDIAAFKYALTALNQIEEKTKERLAEAETLQHRLDYMLGKARKFVPPPGTTEDEDRPPVLAGDPRITLLRELLTSETLRTANALTDGAATDYGLHPRTIRGFRDLRKLWRRRISAGEAHTTEREDRLRKDLHEFQAEHSDTIGSVALFEALLAPKNWIIWQEPAPDTAAAWTIAGYADEPLSALVEERELLEDMASLKEPVRLTPADPVHSRRQYDFHAVSGFGAGARATCRHEPASCAFTTEIARQESGRWHVQRVRIAYSAPRLLRDGLRAVHGSSNLAATRWLQPMMEALSKTPELPQDLTDCPVCLMPDFKVSGERRVLLNFPVTLEPEALVKLLGRAATWEGQFCGTKETPFALRWPADGWLADKELLAWYNRPALTCFTTLGVDLGTRDAGALAHMTITADKASKPTSRLLGEAGGHRWFATLTGTQLIRLPGEDAKVFAPGQPKATTEIYGERGRGASPADTGEALSLCAALGEDPEKLLGPAPDRLSFPQQNDKLLVALRRAQARLARFQSWSWRLRQQTEQETATAEIVLAYPEYASLTVPEKLAAIDVSLLAQRDLASRGLVTLANRILPLRGRRWAWVSRDDGSRAHMLRQTDPGSDPMPRQIAGQRGLSHERMEQIEELRRRCQSLSRALAHAPGERVRIGRSTLGDELPDPCPDLLEKIDHLREQRVDQTAHAILAAALGVRLRAPTKEADTRRARDIHGEYERFRDPVDFIVIEDLSRYLSSQDRARRENTRLMQWCHRQLVTKLRQLCETYGLPVLATPAAYSSRFCSLSGAAGFRAVELTPASRNEAPWRWTLARLAAHESGEKKLETVARVEAERVRGLFDQLDLVNAGRVEAKKPPRTLLAPQAGGPIFIPLGEAPAMQADLNAAINIALRGLAAPAQHDIHHRIRTERVGKVLRLRATSKREKARWSGTPPTLSLPADKATAERVPNLFADVANVGLKDEHATVAGLSTTFTTSRGLWTGVKLRAWDRCFSLNAARLAKWREKAHPDDIPM